MSSIFQQVRNYMVNRPDVQKIISNTGWLFVSQVIRLLVSLIVGSWIARYLGTQLYGYLNIATSFVVIWLPVMKFGLDAIIVHELVNQPEAKQEILGTALTVRFVSSILVSLILLLVIFALNPTDIVLIVLVLWRLIAHTIESLEVITYWFMAQVQSKYTVYAENAAIAITSVLKISAILSGASVVVIGMLIMLDTVLAMIALVLIYRRLEQKPQRWTFNVDLAKSLMKTSFPVMIAGIATSAYMRIDQLMLAWFFPGAAGQDMVGVYAAAVRVAELWYFVPIAIVTSVFPVVIKTKKENAELYYKRLQRLLNLMVVLSYAVAIPTTMFSRFIINLLYGADFADAAPLLVILIWSGVWFSLGFVRTSILHAERQLHFHMWATVLGALANIAVNYLLIPSLGPFGAAVATLLSLIIANHLTTLLYRPVRIIGILQTRAILFPNPFAHTK